MKSSAFFRNDLKGLSGSVFGAGFCELASLGSWEVDDCTLAGAETSDGGAIVCGPAVFDEDSFVSKISISGGFPLFTFSGSRA